MILENEAQVTWWCNFCSRYEACRENSTGVEHERRVVRFALVTTPPPEHSGPAIPPGWPRECVRALASACAWCGDAVCGGVRLAMGCAPSSPHQTDTALTCHRAHHDETDDALGILRNHQRHKEERDSDGKYTQ